MIGTGTTRRDLAIQVAFSVIVAALIGLVVWVIAKPKPIALPPAVVVAVDSERVGRARADSTVRALRDSAARLEAAKVAAVRRSDSLQRHADALSRHADALAARASILSDPSAKADAWRLAYEARTAERDTLLSALAADRVALAAAEVKADRLEAALSVSEVARSRADSVLDAVVKSASVSCSVPGTFGKVGCPSRKAAFIAGAVAAVVVIRTAPNIKNAISRLPVPRLSLR